MAGWRRTLTFGPWDMGHQCSGLNDEDGAHRQAECKASSWWEEDQVRDWAKVGKGLLGA